MPISGGRHGPWTRRRRGLDRRSGRCRHGGDCGHSVREKRLRFLPLPPRTLAALAREDSAAAEAALGVRMTAFLRTEEALWLWRYRLRQMETVPAPADWFTCLVVDDAITPPASTDASAPDPAITDSTEASRADVGGGVVVGYAGFHGPPDTAGIVELGYSVDPGWRRRGYARAILRALLDRADSDPGVRTVRATIRPDNAASLATIAGHGFTAVGEQWDERDGLETIYERPAPPP